MSERTSIVAQRLLNLYRQAHVINGGWAAVNKILIAEADDQVLEELLVLPNGRKIVDHIKNLQSGKTDMGTIERELMPYGGVMDVAVKSEQISSSDLKELEQALSEFQPDEEHLEKIKNLSISQSFGSQWLTGIRSAISGRPDLVEKWVMVHQAARAYELWSKAYALLAPPVSNMARAKIQAELSEYETYLPMFGDDGVKLLSRLRAFVASN